MNMPFKPRTSLRLTVSTLIALAMGSLLVSTKPEASRPPSIRLGGFASTTDKQTRSRRQDSRSVREAQRLEYDRLPLRFEENHGQIDARVKFLARGDDVSLFLTGDEAVISLAGSSKIKAGEPGSARKRRKASVLRMRLINSNAGAEVSGEGTLKGTSNYFNGTDPSKWRSNVTSYSRVRYGNVYPGIDITYYGNRREMEYDFAVAPGANPSVIGLFFDGVTDLEIAKNGDLRLQCAGGDIQQRRPRAYQEVNGLHKGIKSRFVKRGSHQIGFEVGDYDHRLPLIIDPVVVYSTYFGGSLAEEGQGIAVDTVGNVYVTGVTRSLDFPIRNATQPSYGGGFGDAFVMKIDPTGTNVVYATYLGGSGNHAEQGLGIAVDAGGNAYITGFTDSPDFPVHNPLATYSPLQPGGLAAFVTKLSPDGSSIVYSTTIGRDDSIGRAIAVDALGSAYVTGSTDGQIPTLNAVQPAYGQNGDAFVAKLSPDGNQLIYSTFLGGSGQDDAFGLAVDREGNAYVTGETHGICATCSPNNFPVTAGAFQTTPNSENGLGVFVTKIDSAGDGLIYSTFIGGAASGGRGIAVDNSGNAFVTGFASRFFPTTPGAFQAENSGFPNSDAFVTKLNASGSALLYSTYIGGQNTDYAEGIAVDADGQAYVAGITASADFPSVAASQPSLAGTGGHTDAFVSILNPSGTGLIFSTFIGGQNDEEAHALALDSAGSIYVAGVTNSTDFPTKKPLQGTIGGGGDMFLVKLANRPPCGSISLTHSGQGSGFVEGRYVQAWAADGGSAPYNFAITSGAPPPGISLSSSGQLEGTPRVAGNYTFTITATDADGCSGSLITNLFISPSADLSVTETISANSITLGDTVTYSFTVSNHGQANVTAAKLVERHWTEMSVLSVNTTSGTCTQSPYTVTCDFGDMLVGATAVVTVVAKPLIEQTNIPGNTATVSANEPDPDTTNNSASEDLAISAPASEDFSAGNLIAARDLHCATLLQNGKVLIVGGQDTHGVYLSSAEIYDPASGSWSAAGNLSEGRLDPTATLLPSGKVLIVGGVISGGETPNTTELYDPASGVWTVGASLHEGRLLPTATLLNDGRVLITGGYNSAKGDLTSAEIYDPISGVWTITGEMHVARESASATLLANGTVLIAGGSNNIENAFTSCEIFDPASGSWHITGSFSVSRGTHSATLLPSGKVLLAGGTTTTTTELYDPVAGQWTVTGDLNEARWLWNSATLLPNGRVLVIGGVTPIGVPAKTLEIYDPETNVWIVAGSLLLGRYLQTATLLPSGEVLIAGGQGDHAISGTAERYHAGMGRWSPTADMVSTHLGHTATLLVNGKVLGAGGQDLSFTPSAIAELYDQSTATWSSAANLLRPRYGHTASLLLNGKVLVAGGIGISSNPLTEAELYDPVMDTWSNAGSLASARGYSTATLLPNGNVLLTGGQATNSVSLASTEIYDQSSNSWTNGGSMQTGRYFHTATLLTNGQVLVTGGVINQSANLATGAELYDPATGTWTTAGSMNTARFRHTATLLPNGKVLVVGGLDGGFNPLSSAELYDPNAGTWTSTANLSTPRWLHTASLLPDGEVLVAAGQDTSHAIASAEIYDAGSGTWRNAANMTRARQEQTATLLTGGKILVAGGAISSGFPLSSELYDVGLGFESLWQPEPDAFTSPLLLNRRVTLQGSRFRGISEASGGNGSQNSSTNYPLAQLRSLGNGQTTFLLAAPDGMWSDTSFTSLPLIGFPSGYALLTVITNAIPSESKIVLVASCTTPAVTAQPEDQVTCEGASANLITGSSGIPGAAVQWQVSTGGPFANIPGATSTSLSFTANTSQSGNKYRAVFTNTCGSATTTAATLTVNPATTATGPASATVCQGATANFSTTAGGTGPFHYAWTVDGSAFGADNSSISVPTGSLSVGSHPVSVTVTGTCGSVTNNATLTVQANTAATTPGDQTVCQGATANFSTTASGSGPFHYAWTVDGSSFNGDSASISVPTGSLSIGSHPVSVTVSGACGTVTKNATLTVQANTAATTPGDQTVCQGVSANFSTTASGTAPFHYAWTVDGSSFNGDNASISVPTGSLSVGSHPVSVTVSGACGTVTKNATLTVQANTSATTPGDQTVCQGATANFSTTASGTGPFHYAWTVDGSLFNGDSASISVPTGSLSVGSHPVSVTVTGACGSVTKNATLTVQAITTTSDPPDQTVCKGVTAGFSTTASGTGPFHYAWTLDGSPFNGDSPSISVPTGSLSVGNHTVTVTTTGACGSASQSATLTVQPGTTTSDPANQTVCQGATAGFSTTAGGTGPFHYAWTLDGSPFNGDSASISVPTGSLSVGNHTLTVNTTGSCGSASQSATLTVQATTATTDPPDRTACAGSSTTFSTTASGTGPFSFVWKKGSTVLHTGDLGGRVTISSSGSNSTLTISNIQAGDAGSYTVETTGPCGTASQSATLSVNSSGPVIVLRMFHGQHDGEDEGEDDDGLPNVLWPPNHKYHKIKVTDFVASSSDSCDSTVNINSVVIDQVTSDEAENAPGSGNTLNDIVIACDRKSVKLRAERIGGGNGRVYTITFKVTNQFGITSTATAKVYVPKDDDHQTAVDDGPHYTVTNPTCP